MHDTTLRPPPSFPLVTKKLLQGLTQESDQACTMMFWECGISMCMIMELTVRLHWLIGEGVDDLLGVKVLLAVSVLLEQFSRTMSQELVACHLNLESARIPSIVQLEIVWVDERYFFVCDHAFSLRGIGHHKCLLGALAERMFYFGCKLRNRVMEGG